MTSRRRLPCVRKVQGLKTLWTFGLTGQGLSEFRGLDNSGNLDFHSRVDLKKFGLGFEQGHFASDFLSKVFFAAWTKTEKMMEIEMMDGIDFIEVGTHVPSCANSDCFVATFARVRNRSYVRQRIHFRFSGNGSVMLALAPSFLRIFCARRRVTLMPKPTFGQKSPTLSAR